MDDLIENIQFSSDSFQIELKDSKWIDPSMITLMEADDNALPCLIASIKDGILVYRHLKMIPLLEYLDFYEFENEEGYLFLKQLIENALACNRNKPVLLDTKMVYISSQGEPSFTVLPSTKKELTFDLKKGKTFMDEILSHIKVRDDFELVGFLYSMIHQHEFSFASLVDGLNRLKLIKFPKKWFKKPVEKFKPRLKIEDSYFHHQIKKTEYEQELFSPLLEEIEDESVFKQEATREEKLLDFEEMPQEKTQLIEEIEPELAYLKNGKDSYELRFESMIVGRSIQADIRIDQPEISLKHAKITREEDRFYLSDLKSTNHTYIDNQPISRKRRLKNGMEIRFGKASFVFVQ